MIRSISIPVHDVGASVVARITERLDPGSRSWAYSEMANLAALYGQLTTGQDAPIVVSTGALDGLSPARFTRLGEALRHPSHLPPRFNSVLRQVNHAD